MTLCAAAATNGPYCSTRSGGNRCAGQEEGRLKACHGLEIAFCFDNLDAARDLVGYSPEASEVAGRMSRAWISFAKNGDPACDEIPAWPPYEPGERRTMLIDVDWRVANDPSDWARDLWTALDP